MIQISYPEFMSKYASGGQDLTEEELQGIGDFSDLDNVLSAHGQENNMYSVLVRTYSLLKSSCSSDIDLFSCSAVFSTKS